MNNVGVGAPGTVEDNADEQWRAVFDVNVLGIVGVTRAALPALRRSAHACADGPMDPLNARDAPECSTGGHASIVGPLGLSGSGDRRGWRGGPPHARGSRP